MVVPESPDLNWESDIHELTNGEIRSFVGVQNTCTRLLAVTLHYGGWGLYFTVWAICTYIDGIKLIVYQCLCIPHKKQQCRKLYCIERFKVPTVMY